MKTRQVRNMYFVDRERLAETLSHMENLLEMFQTQKNWQTPIEKLALERLVHVVVESFLDVGNQMIDGFIMRDPGSYEDIVDILVDEGVVSKENEEGLKRVVQLRKTLVRDYTHIQHDTLSAELKRFYEDWKAFPEQVRTYLDKELGPVSAFKPTKE
jgi:uncharacterized protein YutE (UPF0331/DUF86 family)